MSEEGFLAPFRARRSSWCILCVALLLYAFTMAQAQSQPPGQPMVVLSLTVPKLTPITTHDIEGVSKAYRSLIGDKCKGVMLLAQSLQPAVITNPGATSLSSLSDQAKDQLLGFHVPNGFKNQPEQFAGEFKKRLDQLITTTKHQLQSQRLAFNDLSSSLTGRAILREYNNTLPEVKVLVVDSKLQAFYASLSDAKLTTENAHVPQQLVYPESPLTQIPAAPGITPMSALSALGAQVTFTIGIIPSASATPTEIVALLPQYEAGIFKAIQRVLSLSSVTLASNPVEDEYPGSCMNGVKENEETDIDCGRAEPTSKCAPCLGERYCLLDSDCFSLNCTLLVCAPTTDSPGFSILSGNGGAALFTATVMVFASILTQMIL